MDYRFDSTVREESSSTQCPSLVRRGWPPDAGTSAFDIDCELVVDRVTSLSSLGPVRLRAI